MEHAEALKKENKRWESAMNFKDHALAVAEKAAAAAKRELEQVQKLAQAQPHAQVNLFEVNFFQG